MHEHGGAALYSGAPVPLVQCAGVSPGEDASGRYAPRYLPLRLISTVVPTGTRW